LAYVGRTPIVGNFVKLDAIVTSATATYNLLNGGVAYFPQTANNCIVSLNGVIQSPTSAYTISGSTIVFSDALTASDSIDFILVLGDVLSIGTPSDGTVGFSKVTSNLITGATAETSIAGGDSILIYDDSASALRKMTRTNFVSGIGGTNTPSFFAYKTSDQNVSDSTLTKITLTSEVYDTDSAYDTTNSKFTVPSGKAGKYLFTYGGLIGNFTDGHWCEVSISVNGTEISPSRVRYFLSTSQSAVVQGRIIYDLAVSDYVEMNVLHVSGGTRTMYGTVGTYFTHFQGFKLI
jgi:hypothetical protein